MLLSSVLWKNSATDVGALPLLSYTLDDMWTEIVRHNDAVLRLPAGAFELGGVLAERANAFLDRNPQWETALRRVLTIRLAAVRTEGDPARRRARRSEFSEDEWRLASELADHPNRLLVTAVPESTEPYAEIAHDKLRDWINAQRDFLAWRTTLDDDRRRWENAPTHSKQDALLLGLALAQAQAWLISRGEDLSKTEREFIDLSQNAERDRREASRQLEIQRVRAEEEVARLRAEKEAQEQRERAATQEMARLRAEREAQGHKDRAAAEEAARLHAEHETLRQRELTRRARWMTVGAASAGILVALGTYMGVTLGALAGEASDFQHHLATFWLSPFTSQSRSKLAGLNEWEQVKKSRSISDLAAYADKYPTSLYYPFVRLRLTRLRAFESGKYTPVLRDSSGRLLQTDEINALNCKQLWSGRNEIYYSVGYCFQSDAAINEFQNASRMPW
jgi:YARHG domain